MLNKKKYKDLICLTFFSVNYVMQCAAAIFFMARDGTLWRLSKEWSFSDSLKASASPAAIYALQNTLLQLSYRNLDSLTFSLLNQTKLVFTAMFMFLFLGYITSPIWGLSASACIIQGISLVLCRFCVW